MKKLRIVLLILFFGLILVGCQIHIHNYITKVIAPTCTEQGFTIYICSCGDSYRSKYVKALGHNYSDWIFATEATCTEEGFKYRECTICEERLDTEVIPVKGHTESDWIIDCDATCLTNGSKHTECTICKGLFETKIIPAKGHQESDWIIDIEATCSTTGSKHKECTVCNKVLETEEIGLKDHNYVNGKCSVCGSIKDVLDFVNGYIYFGEYPQTLKEDSVTITSSTPNSDGYYLGSDGERYEKVVAKPYDDESVFNDETSIVEGNTYYFKVEPIKWKIEEENNGVYKLISTIILDAQRYRSYDYGLMIDGLYVNNYEYSDIRKWLNDEFLNKAFTKKLQTYIATTIVDNSLSSTGDSRNKYICNNTLDKIYLPSVEEMTNTSYGYSSSKSDCDTARKKQLSDYANALGCYMKDYWLRSPYCYDSSYARYVGNYGNICSYNVYITYVGVAPALTITIK